MKRSLRRAAEQILHRLAGRLGFRVVRMGSEHPIPTDCDETTAALIARARPLTLTTPERMMALRSALQYLHRTGVEGEIVECGVWRGGSIVVAAETLLELGSTEREIFMYDTFEYMPPPDERDVHVRGYAFADYYDPEAADDNPIFSYLPFEEVKAAIESTGYPRERLHFVKGLIEETIPAQVPDRIALCRLDTDWYSSTAHEMEHLFPRIVPGGILIIDDYGEFLGARQAVDEYLERQAIGELLHRVDASCRVMVIPHGGLPRK